MIRGIVTRRELLILLTVKGAGRHCTEFKAVVDTGFTGWLSLPPELVSMLELQWDSFGQGKLADGSVKNYDVFIGKVLWNERWRRIRISELDALPLVGMSLLRGCELKMQVRSKGRVVISQLAGWGRSRNPD